MSIVEEMVDAFKKENPYAARADYLISLISDNEGDTVTELLAEAQVNATLALGYEQRQTRFDFETTITNHVEHWIRP